MISTSVRLLALAVLLTVAPAAAAAVPVWGVSVVRAYPHDRAAFTEGLFYLDGYLYESTGNLGASSVRKVELATGRAVQVHPLGREYFGEGIVAWKDRLIQLTWRNQVGFIDDLATLKELRRYTYPGEGWALTSNGRELIMSDGTPTLRFLDPATLGVTHRVTVTADGKPVKYLNELEWVRGEILANVWLTNFIARIDPATGRVTGWIDLTGLMPAADVAYDTDAVPNGIAYDPAHDRLFVTGKLWPKVFEIRLVKRGADHG
ncbi:MAG TPA: glutaminyl-peptide cyclotransferase [Caulobacteraceae bacterium]|jgi:glutaminyl-peptide cyclotransferase|nr:glutaminyl-peptide cyclotransferase [Caulobacteraceae bacterium]